MITLLIVIIVQALIIAVSIKKGIKQLNRAKYWKDEYIKSQKRNKWTKRGEELLQQLTDNNNK